MMKLSLKLVQLSWDSYLLTLSLLGAVRRSVARLAECDPRASHYTTRRPIQCRKACGSTRCLIYVHLSGATAYKRHLTKPHDYVPERPGLAYPLRFLQRDSGCGSVCGWKESGRIYIASYDSGSVRSGNILLYTVHRD